MCDWWATDWFILFYSASDGTINVVNILSKDLWLTINLNNQQFVWMNLSSKNQSTK